MGNTSLARGSWKFLALIYLVYAILPHTRLFTHSHSMGQAGHQHAFLTGHDAALEREALSAISGNGGQVPVGDHSDEQSDVVTVPVESGTNGFVATGAAHQHVAQNSTIPVSALFAALIATFFALLRLPGLRPAFIPDSAALNPSARGPPVFSLSV